MTLPSTSASKSNIRLLWKSGWWALMGVVVSLAVPQVAQAQVLRLSTDQGWESARREMVIRDEWPTDNFEQPVAPTQRQNIEMFPAGSANPNGASQFSGSSNLMAFLRMIRYAEGTSNLEGYQIMFTSRRFNNFIDHPRRMNCNVFRGRQLCSTAAGAYQFLDTTWDMIARSIGATDFGPGWQDRAATELIRRSGALADIEAGNIERAIAKTAGIWASFPRWQGDTRGRYNQAVKPMSELLRVYYRYQQQYLAAR
jgi:muramidase (phage lysozyme)